MAGNRQSTRCFEHRSSTGEQAATTGERPLLRGGPLLCTLGECCVCSPVGVWCATIHFPTAGDWVQVLCIANAGLNYTTQPKHASRSLPRTIDSHALLLFPLGAPLQGLQRDVDNARHRLLTVQGSLAEVSEENASLRRELEGERIKTAAGSRRLADTVERQDNALAKIRLDSAQLREQRDRRGLPHRCTGLRRGTLARERTLKVLVHGVLLRHTSL